MFDLTKEQRGCLAGLVALTKEQRGCLAGLVALSLPKQDQAMGRFNVKILQEIVKLLDLEQEHWQALQPLLYSEGNDASLKKVQLNAFLRALRFSDDSAGAVQIREGSARFAKMRYLALRNLLILFACKALYDARTRHLLIVLAKSLQVSWHSLAKIEALTASHLHDMWIMSHKAKDKVHKGWRYAKIAGAALTGGTILALSGGLAAPALAVGLTAAMGTTVGGAMAGLASTAAVTTLFGVGGAGLVGYKMKKRTEGVKQFEFRRANGEEDEEKLDGNEAKGRMCVCICVSGWLINDESEFDTPWGLEPSKDDVEHRLRLFYQRNNPRNVKYSSLLATEYQGRMEELEKECREKYGASPFDPLPASPTRDSAIRVSDEEREEVFRMIESSSPDRTSTRKKEASSSISQNLTQRMDSTVDKVRRIVNISSPIRNGSTAATPSHDASLQGRGPADDSSTSTSSFEEQEDRLSSAPSIGSEGLMRESGVMQGTERVRKGNEMVVKADDDSKDELQGGGLGGDATANVEGKEDVASARLDEATEELLDFVEEGLSKVSMPWWSDTFPFYETFTLRWESTLLKALGTSVMEMVHSIGQTAALEMLTYTTAAALVSALAWPITLVSAADYIDGTWTMACERSDRAGLLLAEVLMKREYGSRPVVLLGYSMGARLIFSCLTALAKAHEEWEQAHDDDKDGEGSPAAGIIQNVIMMGAPVPVDRAAWRKARNIVAGRLVNCYSKKDWVLGLIYRYQKMTLSASGYSGVENVAGVENIDVSRIIGGHQEYSSKIPEVLRVVALDDSLASSFHAHNPMRTSSSPRPSPRRRPSSREGSVNDEGKDGSARRWSATTTTTQAPGPSPSHVSAGQEGDEDEEDGYWTSAEEAVRSPESPDGPRTILY